MTIPEFYEDEQPPPCVCPHDWITAGCCPRHGCEEGRNPNTSDGAWMTLGDGTSARFPVLDHDLSPVLPSMPPFDGSPFFTPTPSEKFALAPMPKIDPGPDAKLVVSEKIKEKMEKYAKEMGKSSLDIGRLVTVALDHGYISENDLPAPKDALEAKKRADESRRRRLESLRGPKRPPKNIRATRAR